MNTLSRETPAERCGVSELLAPYRPLHVRYAADELVCREGTFAAGAQWIVQGLALESESSTSRGPLAAPPDLLVRGDLLGIEILLPSAEERHCTTCRALTEIGLLFLDRASLERALTESTELASMVIGHLADRTSRMRRARSRLALHPVARLEATLADLRPACELLETEGLFVLPEVIDVRILGELSGLSPAQMRRFSPEVPGLRVVEGGQIAFGWSDVRASLG